MDGTVELRVATTKLKSEAGLGRVRVSTETAAELGLEVGDVVQIIGKKTACGKVMKPYAEDDGKNIIRMDGLTRSNIGVSVDDTVSVSKVNPEPANKIVLAPANIPQGKKLALKPGIHDVFRAGLLYRPVLKGNDIVIPNIAMMGNLAPFTVVSTVPAGIVVINEGTEIEIREEPVTVAQKFDSQITYDDIGGLENELGRIREMIEIPLKHPELFDALGISAPKGVLMYGPPGTGKTLIAKAVAKESGANFYSINGPEIVGKYYGQSEERLRKVFQDAEENSPSIIFIDEIDSIAPNRDDVSGEAERRMVAQLLTLMDGLPGKGDLIVIAATNREDAIDPALRRPGRFDREIEIGIPGRDARQDILNVHTRSMPLDENVSIEKLASMTQGFVGADLAALCREAGMKCISRNSRYSNLKHVVPEIILKKLTVTMDDFMEAYSEIEPSGMREVVVDIPKVQWSDVGGLESVKKEIREIFIPTEEKKSFERLGIVPPKGVLFYGPPGTGKTLIAKAVANESGANFISVNGPEIASKWLGESEKAIRQIFKRAKQMAPCIIFFDEIDSIAPKRGNSFNNVWERIVDQLLTSMDGVESLTNVTVMAATNRPDIIDPALLRPGRFDKMILIGKPNLEGRVKILEVHTKNMPLLDVELIDIAESTEGYVGADLEALCREAALNAYREDHNAQYVTKKHFAAALKLVKPSVSAEDMEMYEKLASEMIKRKTSYDTVPLYG